MDLSPLPKTESLNRGKLFSLGGRDLSDLLRQCGLRWDGSIWKLYPRLRLAIFFRDYPFAKPEDAIKVLQTKECDLEALMKLSVADLSQEQEELYKFLDPFVTDLHHHHSELLQSGHAKDSLKSRWFSYAKALHKLRPSTWMYTNKDELRTRQEAMKKLFGPKATSLELLRSWEVEKLYSLAQQLNIASLMNNGNRDLLLKDLKNSYEEYMKIVEDYNAVKQKLLPLYSFLKGMRVSRENQQCNTAAQAKAFCVQLAAQLTSLTADKEKKRVLFQMLSLLCFKTTYGTENGLSNLRKARLTTEMILEEGNNIGKALGAFFFLPLTKTEDIVKQLITIVNATGNVIQPAAVDPIIKRLSSLAVGEQEASLQIQSKVTDEEPEGIVDILQAMDQEPQIYGDMFQMKMLFLVALAFVESLPDDDMKRIGTICLQSGKSELSVSDPGKTRMAFTALKSGIVPFQTLTKLPYERLLLQNKESNSQEQQVSDRKTVFILPNNSILRVTNDSIGDKYERSWYLSEVLISLSNKTLWKFEYPTNDERSQWKLSSTDYVLRERGQRDLASEAYSMQTLAGIEGANKILKVLYMLTSSVDQLCFFVPLVLISACYRKSRCLSKPQQPQERKTTP